MNFLIFFGLLIAALISVSSCSHFDKLMGGSGTETVVVGFKDTYMEEHGTKY